MTMSTLKATIAAAIAVGVMAAAAGPALAQTKMRVSYQVPTAHHLHKALEFFKADLEKSMNGGIVVELFPAEQLAKVGENHP
jgi:C4-dicarboxylate-binding protein DctP